MTRKENMIALDEKIFLTRKYTTMSTAAQALFLQLWCGADDEGITDKADKTIISTIARKNSRKPAWQELIDNGYIIVSDKPEFEGYAYIGGYTEANSGKRWKKASLHGDFLEAIGKKASVQTTKRPAQAGSKPMQGASTVTRDKQTGPTDEELARDEERRKQQREKAKRAKEEPESQRERELAEFRARGLITDAPNDETERLRAKIRKEASNLFQAM